jgi:hypothetical protein
MVPRCVRVATFALLLISFAPLLGRPAHAQTPTPTPKPGHGPLSLAPHSAPVAGCIAKCRLLDGLLGDFAACVAVCTHFPRPTSTPTPIPPVCCQCGGNTNFPSCFGSQEGCAAGCVAMPGLVCFLDGHCIPPKPTNTPRSTSTPTFTERPTRTPILPVCCQCGGNTNFPRCFEVLEGSCDSCVAMPNSFCGLDGHCIPFVP